MIWSGPTHLVIAKKLLLYLKRRKNVTLQWCAQDCTSAHLPGTIHGYADASFADTIPHWHSSVGYVFLLNRAAISWRASRTTSIVFNAAEPELYSLPSATQGAIYLREVCIELGFLQNSPTIMYEDCQAAVALSKENRFRNRSKHISLRWSFVVERQSLTIDDIAVVSISRTGMLADMFCSPRPASSFIPFCNTILGHPQMPSALLPTEERDASFFDLGSCWLWIPNGSLPCSPIYWHALIMQNTTIVSLSINLMWDLTPVARLNLLWYKVSDSPNFFSKFFFPNSVLLCSFLWAVEWIRESPFLFQTAEGKAPKEAWGGHLSRWGINVTFLHPHEPQLSAMCCVTLDQIDPSYVICIRSFRFLCPHYSTLSLPLPIRCDKISRKGQVFRSFLMIDFMRELFEV